MARWSAFGSTIDGAVLFDLDDLHVTSRQVFPTIESARAEAQERQIHVGGCHQTVPAAVLPTTGNLFGDLVQDTPEGRLGGWARLWIAGFLSTHPNWDGVLCVVEDDLTHWVQISADEVVSFQSFVTGRLIRVLGGGDKADLSAVADSMSRPERLATHLRSAELSDQPDAITGYLIGAEFAASRPYWLGQNVAVIAQSALYSDALGGQGVIAQSMSVDEAQKAGFAALGQTLGLAG